MPCFSPLKGWQKRDSKGITWTPVDALGYYNGKPYNMTVPCGQCIGCRLERSRQWAIRCVHEQQLYTNNAFITLTYNNENLPANGSLDKTHFQKFMKRLRKKHQNKKIRFYACGEYGDLNKRPHYHSIIFNHDFDDKELFKTIKGEKLYTSNSLDEIWGQGFTTTGSVTFESAAYVARYLMKKQTGRASEQINPQTHLKHYETLDHLTGEVTSIQPEYTNMSLKPGIGHDWLDKFYTDIYPSDFITVRGRKMKPPKYYDTYFARNNPEEFDRIKEDRIFQMHKHMHDNTPERLRDKQQVKEAQLSKLIRTL